jgi:hypothetical protein
VADQETVFNPLENEGHEEEVVAGIKRPGTALETHEANFAESHLIELDLDRYVDDFNRRVIGAYREGKGSAVLPADLGAARSLIPPGTEPCVISVISPRRSQNLTGKSVSAAWPA